MLSQREPSLITGQGRNPCLAFLFWTFTELKVEAPLQCLTGSIHYLVDMHIGNIKIRRYKDSQERLGTQLFLCVHDK